MPAASTSCSLAFTTLDLSGWMSTTGITASSATSSILVWRLAGNVTVGTEMLRVFCSVVKDTCLPRPASAAMVSRLLGLSAASLASGDKISKSTTTEPLEMRVTTMRPTDTPRLAAMSATKAVWNATGLAWNCVKLAASVRFPARRGLAGDFTVTSLLMDSMRPGTCPNALNSGSLLTVSTNKYLPSLSNPWGTRSAGVSESGFSTPISSLKQLSRGNGSGVTPLVVTLKHCQRYMKGPKGYLGLSGVGSSGSTEDDALMISPSRGLSTMGADTLTLTALNSTSTRALASLHSPGWPTTQPTTLRKYVSPLLRELGGMYSVLR
mmetsp:Transcript_19358/g.48392  ORF Transcript_19358/g.48392 Transcript_19358/m.48392 type:complete len:323 (-) Transcript_19358:2408-3376(-)